jgi:antitoxin FitA
MHVKAIQIRNVPDGLHRTLRARAAVQGQSLSEYLLGELERSAARPEIADVLRRAELRGGPPVTAEQVVRAIQDGRDQDR